MGQRCVLPEAIQVCVNQTAWERRNNKLSPWVRFVQIGGEEEGAETGEGKRRFVVYNLGIVLPEIILE